MLALLFGPPLVLKLGSRLSFFTFLSVYVLSLVLSVTLYRVSPFHPLSRFPGPFFARISRVWWSYACRAGHQHILLQRLHDKYGDVVRVGPNQLSFREASTIPAIFGARSSWVKHPSQSWSFFAAVTES
jgi:hypothetical protein